MSSQRFHLKALCATITIALGLTIGTACLVGRTPAAMPAPPTPISPELRLVAEEILKAQPLGQPVRVPLSAGQIRQVQMRLAQGGRSLTFEQTCAAVDRASVYLRENPSLASYAQKAGQSLDHRPAIHGNVAEFTEARQQAMVLTRDAQSPAWDLTGMASRPRNAQMKVYADSTRGIKAAMEDARAVTPRMNGASARMLMPAESLQEGAARGLLKVVGARYTPVSGENVIFEPMKSFKTVAESRTYAAEGQQVLQRLSLVQDATQAAAVRAGTKAPVAVVRGGLVAGGKTAERLAAAGSGALAAAGMTLAVDGGIAVYEYRTGQINKAELTEHIQDALVKAAAVGVAVAVVPLLASSPAGWVVGGVAIVTYMATDALITYLREEYGNRYLRIEDLRGIAPDSVLDNPPLTLDVVMAQAGQP